MKEEKIYVTPRCPIRTTSELIGGKWKLVILQQLLTHDELRLSELKRLIPDISEKMLIQELKILVMNDLAKRKDYDEFPPRVAYSISDRGQHIAPLIKEMVSFAQKYEQ
ncbi:winged helix-turn-helix transcriptional regulator [Portibacter marinus]|uniref:winged helix-turn-helix transcriptional regulator n=1 Tax=Portibacter marinus TaxID=2898660 RepID=UPI001F2B2796|nr:helix-turn-helix domain-containing protein [Portibacter marinus]